MVTAGEMSQGQGCFSECTFLVDEGLFVQSKTKSLLRTFFPDKVTL